MSKQRVKELNDAFRASFRTGKVVLTAGVAALPDNVRAAAIERVKTFEDFTADNDPHGEHDFGDFELSGESFFWKIDYYDPTVTFGSSDPSDSDKTTRVLTLMLTSEY